MRLLPAIALAATMSSAAVAQTAASTVQPPSSQAAQSSGAQSPGAQAPGAATAADKPICKSMTPTGTRFPVRECHTKAQWDEMAAQAHTETQDSQRNYGPH